MQWKVTTEDRGKAIRMFSNAVSKATAWELLQERKEEKNELEEEGQVSLSFPRERIYYENEGFLPKRIIRGLLSIVGKI